jgi:exonuclease III
VAAIKGKGAGDPGAIDAIKHLFLEHQNKKGGYEPLWNKKRKAWDMGWLDRIGYLISNHSNSMNITNSVASCWDCFEMVQSDHTPVFLQLKVDVT